MDLGNVGLGEPLAISVVRDGLALDLDVIDARILGQRVVSEDINTLDFSLLGSSLAGDLGNSSIVIQSGQASDVFLLDMRSEVTEHDGVGVGGVGNHDTLDIGVGHLESLGLLDEDELVLVHKI